MTENQPNHARETCAHELGHALVALRFTSPVSLQVHKLDRPIFDTDVGGSAVARLGATDPVSQCAYYWGGLLAEIWDDDGNWSLETILAQFEGDKTLDESNPDHATLRQFDPETRRAGAHLAMTILAEEWERLQKLTQDFVKEYLERGFVSRTLFA